MHYDCPAISHEIMNKRVFISFAIDDKPFRDLLVGQARLDSSPFEFIDMSVKEAWNEQWKTNCRSRIRGCDGVVALISRNTLKADGQLWEINCAFDESIPVMLMYVNDERPVLPFILKGKLINVWSWSNLKSFVAKI
jgi:hypothetical protein